MSGDALLQAVQQLALHGQGVGAQQIQLGLMLGGILQYFVLVLLQQRQCLVRLLLAELGAATE